MGCEEGMTDSSNTERIAVLEVKLETTIKKLDEAAEKINKLHDLYMQAKGASYLGHIITAIVAFVAAKFGGLLFPKL